MDHVFAAAMEAVVTVVSDMSLMNILLSIFSLSSRRGVCSCDGHRGLVFRLPALAIRFRVFRCLN